MNHHDADSILFANANPSFLMYVGILVKRLGYKVFLSLDSAEVVRVAKEQKPSVIVLDYQLPKIDGVSCLGMIRSDTFLRDIPVLMLGHADDGLFMNEIKTMDIQGYLMKPLNVNDFYLAVQKCLKHPSKRRNIRAPLSLKVIITRDGIQKELFASNLSVEGMFLKTTDVSSVGTELDFALSVDEEDPIELKGMVVSVRRSSADIQMEAGMGIKFLDIPEDIRYRLYYFVMRELTKDISAGGTDESWFDETLNTD